MSKSQQRARDILRVSTIVDCITGINTNGPEALHRAVGSITYRDLDRYITSGGASNTAGFLHAWYVDNKP